MQQPTRPQCSYLSVVSQCSQGISQRLKGSLVFNACSCLRYACQPTPSRLLLIRGIFLLLCNSQHDPNVPTYPWFRNAHRVSANGSKVRWYSTPVPAFNTPANQPKKSNGNHTYLSCPTTKSSPARVPALACLIRRPVCGRVSCRPSPLHPPTPASSIIVRSLFPCRGGRALKGTTRKGIHPESILTFLPPIHTGVPAARYAYGWVRYALPPLPFLPQNRRATPSKLIYRPDSPKTRFVGILVPSSALIQGTRTLGGLTRRTRFPCPLPLIIESHRPGVAGLL